MNAHTHAHTDTRPQAPAGTTGNRGATATPDDTAALLAAAQAPTADWLTAHFGADTLWRPAEADLPQRLEDEPTRTFLTTVGFPAIRLDFIGFDSTALLTSGPWEEDPAELFGERYPDDDSPPERYAYGLGEQNGLTLMLMGDTGSIDLYDPNGWDHAAGYGGYACDSLPNLAAALALIAHYEARLTGDDSTTALKELRTLLESLEPTEDSTLWHNLFTEIHDNYANCTSENGA
ncbi:SUKH-4 family immunity protein [Streptomyces pinistramenti]|uniref:SUKH-4 family immunity protein n=1 Tax=Streptomyces pinistramenti TaxID=2884812 RepID=UPI001D086861|nr:SUKH-4 family immunity protein [Streptomyces pinistramenti]MCB5912403.1 SUKH-4 family immunity protein [Streptomyces pinistramenti]